MLHIDAKMDHALAPRIIIAVVWTGKEHRESIGGGEKAKLTTNLLGQVVIGCWSSDKEDYKK